MIEMSLQKLCELVGDPGRPTPGKSFRGVTIDSRENCSGRLFIAIRGDRLDGHDYVESACRNGAVAALVEVETACEIPQIRVADCRLAMARLANHWRHACAATVIAITGSNGKTTVREMLRQILTKQAPTHAAQGNFNNDIGLPLTLFDLSADDRYSIVELGANHPGEIANLARIAEPDIVYVNNAAAAHLAGFGSLRGVIEAKGELYAYCQPHHRAVFNLDESASRYWDSICVAEHKIYCALDCDADIRANWSAGQEGLLLEANYGNQKHKTRLGVFGEHNARNALAAITIAIIAGIKFRVAMNNLSDFSGVKGRLQMLQGPHLSRIIDDTYNANPDSLQVGIKVLCAQKGNAWLALGDMGELGDDSEALHRHAAQSARQFGVEKLFGIGPMSCIASQEFGDAGYCFEQISDMADSIRAQIHQGVNLLVKGSRSAAMEKLVEVLVNHDSGGGVNHAV
jgi:UDP-N-acetylmuramoyl-tripeptide--D-alanyl-D-alanine ligase